MIPSTPSARPTCIRVGVIDSDDRWSKFLAKRLGEHLGAHVDHVRSLVLNGACPDFHVLILNHAADPELGKLRELREKWSERDLPVIVVGDDDDSEVEAILAGASHFVDRSMHPNADLLEKLVYGLAYER